MSLTVNALINKKMGVILFNALLKNCLKLLIVTLFIIDIEEVCVAGRRSGGSSSRSSGSRSSSSSRLSSSRSYSSSGSRTRVDIHVSSSRSHRYYSRPWGYGSSYSYNSWRSYGSAGHIYGYTYYTRTRYHHDHPDREPQICYNAYDYENDNGTEYEYFICPNADQSEDYHYCCGDDDRQNCCGFWDSGSRVGGVVGGFLAFCFICAICAYFCCFRRAQPAAQPFFQSRVLSRRHTSSGCTVQYTVASTGPPIVEVNPPVIGSTVSYGQVQQPMYPVSPLTDVNGVPTNEHQNLQPMMAGGSGNYNGSSVSPPPPYAAVTPYPTVPSSSAPYPSGPAPYSTAPVPYAVDPAASNQPAPYATAPYATAPYPTAPYTSMPYPEAQPPVSAAYTAPTYPGSAPSYPVNPAPPYNMQ